MIIRTVIITTRRSLNSNAKPRLEAWAQTQGAKLKLKTTRRPHFARHDGITTRTTPRMQMPSSGPHLTMLRLQTSAPVPPTGPSRLKATPTSPGPLSLRPSRRIAAAHTRFYCAGHCGPRAGAPSRCSGSARCAGRCPAQTNYD